jgi:aminopeptidase YwaD
MTDPVANRIKSDVETICALGDRDLGTDRNRVATDFVGERLRTAGLEVEAIEFSVPEWRFGAASVKTDGLSLVAHPGPFSRAVDGEGPLAVVRRAEEIPTVPPGAVLLLCGEIASTQLTPRDYPFYSDPAHAAILDALEAVQPLAVLAATTKSAMTGAMSPFPLIEETRFGVPSAYMTAEDGSALAQHAGRPTSVVISSEVLASNSIQLTGRRRGTGTGRVVVSAHIDSKPDTPGAIDNAAGVAVMLALGDLLGETAPRRTVELVPFNGEDHVLAPGELAWLAANPDLSDIILVVNVDAAGLPGEPSAYSMYGLDEKMRSTIAELSQSHPRVAEGPQWPASDHMIFAMRGIPAVAVTSTDFATASGVFSHTPNDVPEILDYDVLADTARFIAALIDAV